MARFLLNKLGYWPRLEQRADGAYVDGAPEQCSFQLSRARGRLGSYLPEYYLIYPQWSGSQAYYPQQSREVGMTCK
jgi:hypothetical protein